MNKKNILLIATGAVAGIVIITILIFERADFRNSIEGIFMNSFILFVFAFFSYELVKITWREKDDID